MKQCRGKCQRVLDASWFGKNKDRSDGRAIYCMDCNRTRSLEHRKLVKTLMETTKVVVSPSVLGSDYEKADREDGYESRHKLERSREHYRALAFQQPREAELQLVIPTESAFASTIGALLRQPDRKGHGWKCLRVGTSTQPH